MSSGPYRITGRFHLGSAVTNRANGVGRVDIDIRTRVGEQQVLALDRGASVANVGDEHVRAAADGIRDATDLVGSLAGTTDGHSSAVHVHLAVADLVEPGPGEDGVAGGSVVRQGEIVARVTHDRTVTHVRVDNLPRVAAVEGQRSLATAAIMGSVARDGHLVRLARSPSHDRLSLGSADEVVVSLAGEVAAARIERRRHIVVDAGGVLVELGAEWGRIFQFHVGLAEGGKANNGSGEQRKGLHGDFYACSLRSFTEI